MDRSEFGSLLRELRQKRAMQAKLLAEEAGVHPGYLSNIEAGRTKPARETVIRLAAVLNVPAATLLDVWQAPPRPATHVPETPTFALHLSANELQLVRQYRELGGRAQQFLLQQIMLMRTFFGAHVAQLSLDHNPATTSPSENSVDLPQELEGLYSALGRAYSCLGDALMDRSRRSEALAAYREARSQFVMARDHPNEALAVFRAGRVYQALGWEALSRPERVENLGLAETSYIRAEQLLTDTEGVAVGAGSNLPDEARERFPELLANLADVLTRLAAPTNAEDGLSAREHEAVRSAFLIRAAPWRQRAATRYEEWIQELQSRTKSIQRDELLAEALHRRAYLLRGMAMDARAQAAAPMYEESVSVFVDALRVRRSLALCEQSGSEPAERRRERLGNTHQELGWVFYNSKLAEWDLRALWQFRVAGAVHNAYLPGNNPHLSSLMESLRSAVANEGRWTEINAGVEACLIEADIVRLIYRLDLFAPPNDESGARS